MIVLSLGWGIQSWTIASMVALGELPPIDAAIHADTTYERTATYEFATRHKPWLEQHGVRVITVTSDSPRKALTMNRCEIPAFTFNGITKGQLRRQCTEKWKIRPIRKWMQANRNKQPVEVWIGISTDEFKRMKPSDVQYVTNKWPLIDADFSRDKCIAWLMEHKLDIPTKSACVFCPYHDTSAWRELKNNGGSDWSMAIKVDQAIRKTRPPFDLYVHPARKPLTTIDFRSVEEKGQLSLWDDECTGICGV